jgi:hypothetical protein
MTNVRARAPDQPSGVGADDHAGRTLRVGVAMKAGVKIVVLRINELIEAESGRRGRRAGRTRSKQRISQ